MYFSLFLQLSEYLLWFLLNSRSLFHWALLFCVFFRITSYITFFMCPPFNFLFIAHYFSFWISTSYLLVISKQRHWNWTPTKKIDKSFSFLQEGQFFWTTLYFESLFDFIIDMSTSDLEIIENPIMSFNGCQILSQYIFFKQAVLLPVLVSNTYSE